MDIRKVARIFATDLPDMSYKCRLIADRQDFDRERESIERFAAKHKGLTPFVRTDMFWIEVTCAGDVVGTISIDNNAMSPKCDPTDFGMSPQWVTIEDVDGGFFNHLREWFRVQPEFLQQQEWVRNFNAFWLKTSAEMRAKYRD